MPRARSTPCALAALLLGAAPFAHAASVIDASSYVAIAATGELVPDPATKVTYDVVDGSRTLPIPQGMDYVPAGSFTMGEGAQGHVVKLDAFAIGRFEVTNAEWLEFVDATGRPPPRHWTYGMPPVGTMNLPITFVSWADAQDYCAWRSGVTGWNFALPTEAQWERAARGPRGFAFPWGAHGEATFAGGALTSRCNYNGVCAAATLARTSQLHYTRSTFVVRGPLTLAPLDAARAIAVNRVLVLTTEGVVQNWRLADATLADFVKSDEFADLVAAGGAVHTVGSYPSDQSEFGPHDMAGNVAEWTADWYAANYDTLPGARENPTGPSASAADLISAGTARIAVKVVRGGSWADDLATARSTARDFAPLDSTFATVGFRVVVNFPKASTSSTTGSAVFTDAAAAPGSANAAASIDGSSTVLSASTATARISTARRLTAFAAEEEQSPWTQDLSTVAGIGLGALLGGTLLVFLLRRKKT